MSSSPASALSKYRIPRKSLQDVSSSLESDFDPLYVSSPGRQRSGAKTSSNKEFKDIDTPSRLERNSVDSRKKHDVDNNDTGRSRIESVDEEEPARAHKYSRMHKGLRSTETYNAEMKGKCDTVKANQNERSEESRWNNDQISEVDNSGKFTDRQLTSRINNDRLRNDSVREISKRKERRQQSGESVFEDRKKLCEETNMKSRDYDKCEISGTKDSGRDMKKIDLREKLRQKRLEKQSGHNADTKESTVEQNSAETSFMLGSNARDKQNVIKLKRIDDKPLCNDHSSLSIFQSREKKKMNRSKESEDLAAEKEFLEQLKTTVKKNEGSSPYNTKSVMCSDKVTNTVAEVKTQDNSIREITSYSDINPEMSKAESIIITEKIANDEYFSAASSESYFSASDYPCNKSTPKTKLQSKDKKTSFEMSDNDLPVENGTKKTFLKDLDRMEVDSDLTGKDDKQDIQGCEKKIVKEKDMEIQHETHDSRVKNSSKMKERERGRENSQAEKGHFQEDVDRCDKVNTCKEGELIDTESDGMIFQNSSCCNTEIQMHQKCLRKDVENDNPELLRRSARLSSKSDSSVRLCESAKDNRKGGKTKKSVQNENIDNSVSKEEMDMARKISSGTIKSVDTRRKKRRIRRSVTSETISSVTSVDMSEGFSSVSEEIDDSSQSTENTSTSDDFENLDKNEKSQKWVCTHRNCTIRMRHLHPKCNEPNLIREKIQKNSQEVLSEGTDSLEDISEGKNADESEKLDSSTSNKTDKMKVNIREFEIPEGNFLSSEGKIKSQCIEPELVKENSMLNVSNGTVELAKEGCDSSSSSYSSESEQSSGGSRSFSDSSASSDSSSESDSETVNQDIKVMAVDADKEHVTKSPVQSTNITEMASIGNKEHSSKPGISKASNSQKKKSEVDNGKGRNSPPDSAENLNNENLKPEGVRSAAKSLLSVPSETSGKNEKEKHSAKQNELGREEVIYLGEKKTKTMDEISDQSRIENNRSDICKGVLRSEDKEVNRNDVNSSLSAKDKIQIEKEEAAELIECYKQDTSGMAKNTLSTRKDTAETNASNDASNKSSSFSAHTHGLSDVIKHIDQVMETVTCESSESALQHLENCDVKDNEETGGKPDISESESEGSFGSNIMSERTGSSLTDDESDFSDSDNSTGSSYSGESSYSSSDESGSGSSWDSSSSYSESEYDGDTGVKALPDAKPNGSTRSKQLVPNTSSQEKTFVKETRTSEKDLRLTPVNSTNVTEELLKERSALDKHDYEIAVENQQGDGSVHHDKNEMEVDEETSSVCQNHKNYRFENVCLKEKTILEKNVHEKSSVAKCSKTVSPMRSHLLQTLLKCVQIDLKVQEPVTEIDKDESKIEKFLIPTMKKSDSTKTNEEFLVDKAIDNSSENCCHEEKQTLGKNTTSFENVGHVTQTKSSKMLEMDLCDENDRHVSEMLQLDVGEITKKDKSSKSEKVSVNYEKAETPHQDTVASSKDVGGSVSKKGEYENSSAKLESKTHTKRGQKSNETSKENIFGSTSSLSDTSDSDDSSSWSGSHSSGCSTCLSDSGSATDIEPAIPAESEKNCNQRSKTVGTANVNNHEKLKKTQEMDISINCETAECRGAANEVKNEKNNTLANNTGGETLSLKPCENNPYWIADEIPEFLSLTENKENQIKKSPSLNSTSSGDTKPLTPAVKFVKLNMSPSQMQAVSPNKRCSLSPNTGNDAKSASGVKGSIGVISSVIDKSDLSKSSESGKTNSGEKSKRSQKARNKGKSLAPGNSKDSHNHGRDSLAKRNLKETTGGTPNNTNIHKDSDGKGHESKLSIQRKENKSNTNSLCSQNLRVESSKRTNLRSKDASIEEAKSKKLEKCPSRRSPRKKPSNTSVTDLKTNRKGSEKNEKKHHMTKIQNLDSSTSKIEEHLNVKSVKSTERLNNLKSIGKTTVISKASDDVSKTKERSSKQSSSAGQKEKFTESKLIMKNKHISSCKENRKNESMQGSKVASKKTLECEQAETRKCTTSMLLDISEAKDEVICRKNSSEDKAVSLGKKSIRDTTKILSERIMKLKVEKNLLEKELKEKQRQEHVPLKIKVALPKRSEVKSNKDTKENMLKGNVFNPACSRSGKSKPLTVALAANGSEHLKSKSYNKHTGSLNKYETLTFEEKLTSDVEYLSKSKSADKGSEKTNKQMSLIPQAALLKAFTIPKVTKGKQCSGQLKDDKIVTKSRSESSAQRSTTKSRSESLAQRSTGKSSVTTKEKSCGQSAYSKEQKKGDYKSDNNRQKIKYMTSSDSESSESNNDSESDSQSGEEDNDALVKAVFGSSDSSGNSGKSLTLDDLCKTRSSEDTDDIVRNNIVAVTRNTDGFKEIRGNERTLSEECAEIAKLKSKKSPNHSKCFDQSQKGGKHTSESKASCLKGKHSRESSTVDKDHSVGKSTFGKQGQSGKSASTDGDKCLRKSPRIQALESTSKSFQHQKECLDSNYKEAHLKEFKRLNRTPKKCAQEITVCQNKIEARYFELSNKNPVLNKIISPKKPKHPSQPENEDILIKKTSTVLSETNESEKQTRKETKSIPLLLLEESTMDGIDYHDDVTYDSDCGNSTGEAAESEESSEKELNNKERSIKKLTDSDSDQSVEEGEVSESDEENITNKSEQENLKRTSQTCNKIIPSKFEMLSNKGRLSPVKYPSNESSCDRDSACKCAKRTCIHKRLGVSDMKQTKRYRSDSDSNSDSSSVRPKRRMRHDHSSTRKRSRSCDKTYNQRNRRRERFFDSSGRRSVLPRNRKSPHRCRKLSGSRSTSPLRRRRSRSCSRVRSRPLRKDYRTARSRHRYRDEADSCSPGQYRRNRSYSGDTSASTDRSYHGKNHRSNKNTSETAEKSSNQSYLMKTRSNKDSESGSENKRIETLDEKCLSGASAACDSSSDEANERFSKLKSEKCTEKKYESKSVRRAVRNRDHCRRNKSYTLDTRYRSRSRSPSRKRKRCVSGSESDTDFDTKRKRDGRVKAPESKDTKR